MTGLPKEATNRMVDPSRADAYAAWCAHVPPRDDPYYSERAVRFEFRDADVLRAPGDVVVRCTDCGIALASANAHASMELCGVSERDASAIVAAIDGMRTVARARTEAAVEPAAWSAVVGRAFGSMLFAPSAVEALERRVSGAEIVRYPGSPYEIVRSYWENMGDVAATVAATRYEGQTVASFIELLRALNIAALVGAGGRSFYLPASPVVVKGAVEPGALWTSAPIVEPAAAPSEPARFVSGPRVNASFIGGQAYHALLSKTLGDAAAAEPSRDFDDESGLPWGRVVVARADHDERATPWFCPPRPLDTRHFEALRIAFGDAVAAAVSGDSGACVRALAMFHRRFIRLHPFRAANQCVAMSLVNHVLRLSRGAGMPHLVLDHLALRLSPEAYARAFAIAVGAWLVANEDPVERYLELIARKNRCFDFLKRLGDAKDAHAAECLARERPDDAALAFVRT